jgi:hypothetical protein
VRVVADSHVLIFYLLQPEKLTDQERYGIAQSSVFHWLTLPTRLIGSFWPQLHS